MQADSVVVYLQILPFLGGHFVERDATGEYHMRFVNHVSCIEVFVYLACRSIFLGLERCRFLVQLLHFFVGVAFKYEAYLVSPQNKIILLKALRKSHLGILNIKFSNCKEQHKDESEDSPKCSDQRPDNFGTGCFVGSFGYSE